MEEIDLAHWVMGVFATLIMNVNNQAAYFLPIMDVGASISTRIGLVKGTFRREGHLLAVHPFMIRGSRCPEGDVVAGDWGVEVLLEQRNLWVRR